MVNAVEVYRSSVQVLWGSVVNATSYTISCSDGKTTVMQLIEGSENETVVPGLFGNTTYSCCVSSTTTNGESEGICTNITTSLDEDDQCATVSTITVTASNPTTMITSRGTPSSSLNRIAAPSSDSTGTVPISSSSLTISSTNFPSSSESVSPVASWIGGIVIGAVIVAVIALALLLVLGLVWYRGHFGKRNGRIKKDSSAVIVNSRIE